MMKASHMQIKLQHCTVSFLRTSTISDVICSNSTTLEETV